jgi:hypothetical protein
VVKLADINKESEGLGLVTLLVRLLLVRDQAGLHPWEHTLATSILNANVPTLHMHKRIKADTDLANV